MELKTFLAVPVLILIACVLFFLLLYFIEDE